MNRVSKGGGIWPWKWSGEELRELPAGAKCFYVCGDGNGMWLYFGRRIDMAKHPGGGYVEAEGEGRVWPRVGGVDSVNLVGRGKLLLGASNCPHNKNEDIPIGGIGFPAPTFKLLGLKTPEDRERERMEEVLF